MKQLKKWICPETKECIEIPNLHRGCRVILDELLLESSNDEDALVLLEYQRKKTIVVDFFSDEQQMCWDRHLSIHIPYELIGRIEPYSVCEGCWEIINLDEFQSDSHRCSRLDGF